MPILNYLWIIPALPLLGSAINGFFGSKWPNKIVNTVAVGSTGLSFLAALEAVREFMHLAPEPHPGGNPPELPKLVGWKDNVIPGIARFDLHHQTAHLRRG